MAYDPNNLSALTYANGFTLWHYRTRDALDDVKAPGYFDQAVSMFRVGDFAYVNAGEAHATIVVAENRAGTVTIVPIGTATLGQAARDAAA